MGPAVYILAILGCGEGETQCQPVAVAPASYHSQADCNAATEDQLMQHGDAAYPVVVAQCQRADSAAAQIWADEVKLPAAEGADPRVRHATYDDSRTRS